MSIYYSENSFLIDMIRDAYETEDVKEIKLRASEDFDTEISILDIYNHLVSNNVNMISTSIMMKEHFKEFS